MRRRNLERTRNTSAGQAFKAFQVEFEDKKVRITSLLRWDRGESRICPYHLWQTAADLLGTTNDQTIATKIWYQ